MLILDNVTISLQNFTTRFLIFLQGAPNDIEMRHNSFYNHGTTDCSLEYMSDRCAFFWLWDNDLMTCSQQFQKAMEKAALFEILSKGGTKGTNPMNAARQMAALRIGLIEWVHWYKSEAHLNLYDLGTSVKAEKGGDEWNDFLGGKLERPGAANTKEELEEETA